MGTKLENKDSVAMPILQHIESSLVKGVLPEDYRLPYVSEGEVTWAPGALDGVTYFHGMRSDPDKKVLSLMEDALRAASDGETEKADELFGELGEEASPLELIDPLQKYISESSGLNGRELFRYAVHMLTGSSDPRCVKFGLSVLELFATEDIPELKECIRLIGLSDEFTLFALYIMRSWKDGNSEILQLARKVRGWGRIFAVELLEPETEEIARWLLFEGVDNDVMPAYSALTCWNKSGAWDVLTAGPSKEEFSAVGRLLSALFDEEAVYGISMVQNAKEVVRTYLETAGHMALSADDYGVISSIREYYAEDGEKPDAEITSRCRELLSSDDCKAVVSEAVKEGRFIHLAKELGLAYQDAALAAMEADFGRCYTLCLSLMNEPDYKDAVLDVFRKKLPLSGIAAGSGKTALSADEDWKLCLILQGLDLYPLEGMDFIEAGLSVENGSSRARALRTLESWVSQEEKPLSELLPDLSRLLSDLRDTVTDADTTEKIDALLSGRTSFDDPFGFEDDEDDEDDEENEEE